MLFWSCGISIKLTVLFSTKDVRLSKILSYLIGTSEKNATRTCFFLRFLSVKNFFDFLYVKIVPPQTT